MEVSITQALEISKKNMERIVAIASGLIMLFQYFGYEKQKEDDLEHFVRVANHLHQICEARDGLESNNR